MKAMYTSERRFMNGFIDFRSLLFATVRANLALERSAPSNVFDGVRGYLVMRQSRSLAAQALNRPRRIKDFRRATWSPRQVRRIAPRELPVARDYIPGEFDEPHRSAVMYGLGRAMRLTWDFTILSLLSPFFLVWFLYRAAVRAKKAFQASRI